MLRRTFLAVATFCTLALVLAAPSRAKAADAASEHVILVSIDGWAHHYFDDPKCHMPATKALAAKGVRGKRMICSFPTVTWTNHTTLVTGVIRAVTASLPTPISTATGRKVKTA